MSERGPTGENRRFFPVLRMGWCWVNPLLERRVAAAGGDEDAAHVLDGAEAVHLGAVGVGVDVDGEDPVDLLTAGEAEDLGGRGDVVREGELLHDRVGEAR